MVEMAKKATILVKMTSTAGTGYFYVKKRNPKKLTEKLSMRKYDPVARKHVVFEEKKMPNPKAN
jgi:large subunit ribosomal protein L33